jgi:hypothetical protein
MERFQHRWAYYAAKPRRPANRAAHAEDKSGAARFESAESDVRDHAHIMFPRVPPTALAFSKAPA